VGALTQENRLRIAWALGVLSALALILAQFLDYTGIEVGSGGVESAVEVAPTPKIGTEQLGSVQLWIGIPLGIAALIAMRLAGAGQWRLGRSLAAIGAIMLVVTIAIALPNGLDETDFQVAYTDAHAVLLAGFWVQLVASIGMIASGLAMVSLRHTR